MRKTLTSPQVLVGLILVVVAIAHVAFGYSPITPGHMLLAAFGVTQMTTAQARVIDPILTTVAQGYRNSALVYRSLFPVVPVGQRGGKIIQFGREDFRQYAAGRAPGSATKRVQFGYAGDPYSLSSYSLEGVVPLENMQDASVVPGIDLGRNAVIKTQNAIQLGNEITAAGIATNAATYAAANKITLAGTSQWSDHTSGVSSPSNDVQTAIDAVRASCGLRANTVVLGPKVWSAIKQHPAIIDRIKYTGRDSITLQMLASLWDVQNVAVGDALYEDATGNLVDVWGKYVVVAYTELGGIADQGLPSYGYTYRLQGYPIVEMPYQDRNAKSWIYPVTDEVQPVLASPISGYLISGAVA